MKEVTYEDWQKNPTPRMMWVWDNDEKDRLKMTVVYIIASECNFPVVALGESGNIYCYRHCAEIVKEQKTSKGFYVYNPAGSKPSHIHETLEEAKAEADLATIAYMQGAERYKTKWHNLQKNPKDLPEPHSTVLDENGDKITYCGGDMWTVYSEYYEKGIDAEPPKAWCKVPTFEE